MDPALFSAPPASGSSLSLLLSLSGVLCAADAAAGRRRRWRHLRTDYRLHQSLFCSNLLFLKQSLSKWKHVAEFPIYYGSVLQHKSATLIYLTIRKGNFWHTELIFYWHRYVSVVCNLLSNSPPFSLNIEKTTLENLSFFTPFLISPSSASSSFHSSTLHTLSSSTDSRFISRRCHQVGKVEI